VSPSRRARTTARSAPAAALAAILTTSLATSLAAATPLFSNGTFVTNPTGGTGSIAGQPISNADGFTVPGQSFVFSTTGVGATALANTAVAEDFTVPASGWDVDTLTVYAFQTSQSQPSVTQVRVNLWRAAPYSAGSPSLPGVPLPDPLPQPILAESLVLDAGPGTLIAHRQSATSTSTVRPVFAYTVSLDALPDAGRLAEGTYWIEWSFVGATAPSQNVFTPLISPRDQVAVHNARLFNALSGNPADPRVWFEGREGFVAGVSDGRAYSLPFELGGTPIPAPGFAAVASLSVLTLAGRSTRRRRA
jgi:hypothetical protein